MCNWWTVNKQTNIYIQKVFAVNVADNDEELLLYGFSL